MIIVAINNLGDVSELVVFSNNFYTKVSNNLDSTMNNQTF